MHIVPRIRLTITNGSPLFDSFSLALKYLLGLSLKRQKEAHIRLVYKTE
jgi:hypothetical protein